MRKKIGILLLVGLALLPLLRWVFLEPLNYRFFNFIATATSLGQIAGIIGLSLFSLNLIISARIKLLERFFYGLDRVYNYHHKIGALSFSLLLFHPILLVINYLAVSLKEAADFFIPFKDLPITYGIFGLLIMIILLGLTFYAKMKYNHWKFSHKFMVLAFGFALLHALYISSDISQDTFLRVYLLTLGFIGLALGFYQAFLSRLINSDIAYTLKRVEAVNTSAIELELEPKGRTLKFHPGQFVFVTFKSKQVKAESHPFSITSKPGDNNLNFVIKSLGDFTGQLKKLEPGISVSIEGPYGKFSNRNIPNRKQIWIAGGVGITPFISMARSLDASDYSIDLHYAVRKEEEAILISELKAFEVNKGIRFFLWNTEKQGYINAEAIAGLSPSLNESDILLCGPSLFMSSLRQQFINRKINKKRIHFENFKLV